MGEHLRCAGIDHVIPRSKDPSKQLDFMNVVVCCKGGTDQILRNYPDHYLENAGANPAPDEERRSCDKRRLSLDLPLDPRMLPLVPRCCFVDENSGEIYIDKEGCKKTNILVSSLEDAIRVMNLNCRRLCHARKRAYQAIESEWSEESILAEIDLPRIARLLSPDARGRLKQFWTVWRCYFRDKAEEWLSTSEACAVL